MRTALWLLDRMYARRLAVHTSNRLAKLVNSEVQNVQVRASALLEPLATEKGPHVILGETQWHQQVSLPLRFVTTAHGIITGGSGAGKSRAALLIIQELLRHPELDAGFGVLDAKGELFEAVLCLLAQAIAQLPKDEAQRLIDRVVIVDLSCQDPVSPYNIARPWEGSDQQFFVNSRVDALQELLAGGDELSIRGVCVLRHLLWLLAELGLPFGCWERVLSSDECRAHLLIRTRNEELRHYFVHQFPNEGKSTVAAVRVRLASTVFGSTSLRMALSVQEAPDFRKLQDEGKVVLISCAGNNIPRSTARTLQALFLSDIRAGVFARRTHTPFLWFCDEAQHLTRTRQLRETLDELLRMSRSFGSYFLLITQNLSSAVQDADMLDTIRTNVKWTLSLRSSPRDAAFLQSALPVTGRMRKPQANPYQPAQFYSSQEERSALLEGMASLKDREGWLWLKSLSPQAIRITSSEMKLPSEREIRETADRIKFNAAIGQRVSHEAYLADIQRRDQEFCGSKPEEMSLALADTYQKEQEMFQCN